MASEAEAISICSGDFNVKLNDKLNSFSTRQTKTNKIMLWKLNLSILNSPQIKEAVEKEIQGYLEFSDTGEVEPPVLWVVKLLH